MGLSEPRVGRSRYDHAYLSVTVAEETSFCEDDPWKSRGSSPDKVETTRVDQVLLP